MDIELARHCVRAAFRAAGELEGALHALKAGCAPDEYDGCKLGIANAIYEMSVALTNKAIAAHPELEGRSTPRSRSTADISESLHGGGRC